jgi:hypothetical protein
MMDEGAKLLLLLWRTWQVRNNLMHDEAKLSVESSIGFLRKYWAELCDARQHPRPFDAKGKRPISDSLVAGKREAKVHEAMQHGYGILSKKSNMRIRFINFLIK